MSQTSTGDASQPRRDVSRPATGKAARGGFFARIALFLRQVLAELRKVVRPTRQELITYTVVCMFFVIVMMALTSGLDYGFGQLVLWVFGGGGS